VISVRYPPGWKFEGGGCLYFGVVSFAQNPLYLRTAIDYAIHCQRDRRNLSDNEITKCIMVKDSRKQRGGLRDMVVDPETGRFTTKAQTCANADDTPEKENLGASLIALPLYP
jgi:hypothetical protein